MQPMTKSRAAKRTTKPRRRPARREQSAREPLPAWQNRSRDKRDRLIEAGLDVFGTLGYDAARVADIARAARLSVGVFYQRFRDKRALFGALEDEFVARTAERTARFLDKADPRWSPIELFEALLEEIARVMRRYVGFFRGLVSLAHRDSDVIAPGLELDRRNAAALFRHLVECESIGSKITERDVSFALASASKVLLVFTLLRGERVSAGARLDVRELARMMAAYLGINRA
jgi:AcrR family transcriptional regulator